MAHLSPDEFVDLAEGVRAESSAPHLSVCEACRAQLTEMRALLGEIASLPVPEPSPLFWDHLSERVRVAVAATDTPRPSHWRFARWSWGVASALSVVVAGLAVVVTLRSPAAPEPKPRKEGAMAVSSTGLDLAPASDDSSLGLLADLAGELEWDTAAAGMAASASSADLTVDLTADERAELRRLLDEAMAGKGA